MTTWMIIHVYPKHTKSVTVYVLFPNTCIICYDMVYFSIYLYIYYVIILGRYKINPNMAICKPEHHLSCFYVFDVSSVHLELRVYPIKIMDDINDAGYFLSVLHIPLVFCTSDWYFGPPVIGKRPMSRWFSIC